MCRGHHACLRAQIVEDDERVGEDEQRIGHVHAARRRRRQALDEARDVVAEVADRAAPELADLRRVDRIRGAEQRLEVGERIRGPAGVVPPPVGGPIVHHSVLEPPRGSRSGAHERVSRPRLAAGGRRLEKERERSVTDLGERRDRRIRVEQHVAPHGDETGRAVVGETRSGAKFVETHAAGCSSRNAPRYSQIMLRFLAARGRAAAACMFVVVLGPVYGRAVVAQTWNDPRSLTLVAGATQRRAEQLADTGLADYRATAHGYVTFLAQLGEGLRTPPKVIKADELALEVYWHAPNLSKQRIVGRRDTLLLPTDIAYHRDHLGIVQNNFPNIIRIGEGDEVADVPHPLSPAGLREYDFALTDSFAIGAGAQRINVYEIKVRPKDDKKARVAGAIYIDPSGGQVVRMNFGFTRAAFLDNALEDLSIVLENRLVGGRFWLPSRQEIEIERRGTWLDYPVRGIIRGRWEIGDYQFNTSMPTQIFAGPEIVQAPPAELRSYTWKGRRARLASARRAGGLGARHRARPV